VNGKGSVIIDQHVEPKDEGAYSSRLIAARREGRNLEASGMPRSRRLWSCTRANWDLEADRRRSARQRLRGGLMERRREVEIRRRQRKIESSDAEKLLFRNSDGMRGRIQAISIDSLQSKDCGPRQACHASHQGRNTPLDS